jgi:5-(carboxyamino)imidazole ribonucleotide synthase
MNLELGPTDSIGHAGMVNLLGDIPDAARSLARGYLHDYGKEPRPGRKLGHITVTAETGIERDELVDIIRRSAT